MCFEKDMLVCNMVYMCACVNMCLFVYCSCSTALIVRAYIHTIHSTGYSYERLDGSVREEVSSSD